jgi:hypothetical protein
VKHLKILVMGGVASLAVAGGLTALETANGLPLYTYEHDTPRSAQPGTATAYRY